MAAFPMGKDAAALWFDFRKLMLGRNPWQEKTYNNIEK